MMRCVLLLVPVLLLTGCPGHKLTGYNLKTTVGQTTEDNGGRSVYTGASADLHFDVK